MLCIYKQCFIEEVTFLESAEKQNIDVFFFIPTMKTLLSLNIPTIFEMEYVWTKEETFVTLFLSLCHAALLAKKSDCFRYILKGNIYHQMSNCIKSRILNVYGLLSDCLFFLQGRY